MRICMMTLRQEEMNFDPVFGFWRILLPFFLIISGISLGAQTERILNYDTQIEVHEDRSITVTEFIEVYVAGDRIKRGITRSLPTRRNLNDKSVRVRYQISGSGKKWGNRTVPSGIVWSEPDALPWQPGCSA
jgi:hypothetical protein